MHWGLAGPLSSSRPTVPWSKITASPRDFVDEEFCPDDLLRCLKDPSTVVVEDCSVLLTFWYERQVWLDRTDDMIEDANAEEEITKVFEWSHWTTRGKGADIAPRYPRRKINPIPKKPGSGGSDKEIEMQARSGSDKEIEMPAWSGKEGAKDRAKSRRSKQRNKTSQAALRKKKGEAEWNIRGNSDEEGDESDDDADGWDEPWGGIAEDHDLQEDLGREPWTPESGQKADSG
ncbi:hypothetical protein EST38_g4106, partial [Candolleomyces aberdarensis]